MVEIICDERPIGESNKKEGGLVSECMQEDRSGEVGFVPRESEVRESVEAGDINKLDRV